MRKREFYEPRARGSVHQLAGEVGFKPIRGWRVTNGRASAVGLALAVVSALLSGLSIWLCEQSSGELEI